MCPASKRFVWAISGVSRSNGLVCSRAQEKKKENKRLTANFAHAQPRPLWTDCNQILYMGSGGRYDHWCQVLWKSVKKFWSYRTPKRHFLYLTFVALTTVSAPPCCTVITDQPTPKRVLILLWYTCTLFAVTNYRPIVKEIQILLERQESRPREEAGEGLKT